MGSACQWSGVATITASTSLRSSTRRKSFTVSGFLPRFSSTSFAAAAAMASSTSQTTGHSTSGLGRNVARSPLPMPPHPIRATRSFSLAGAAWARPEPGAATNTPPSKGADRAEREEALRKRRRSIVCMERLWPRPPRLRRQKRHELGLAFSAAVSTMRARTNCHDAPFSTSAACLRNRASTLPSRLRRRPLQPRPVVAALGPDRSWFRPRQPRRRGHVAVQRPARAACSTNGTASSPPTPGSSMSGNPPSASTAAAPARSSPRTA